MRIPEDPIRFELPTCVVREWMRGDEPSIVRYANNRKVWINLRDHFPHPYTMTDARQWVERATTDLRGLAFAISVDDFAAGGIGVMPCSDINRNSAEIGYWVGEPLWGKGIATEAVQAVTRYAFDTLGFLRLYAEVLDWNRGSMRVLEKAGYEVEGRLRRSAMKAGELVDQILYARVSDRLPQQAGSAPL